MKYKQIQQPFGLQRKVQSHWSPQPTQEKQSTGPGVIQSARWQDICFQWHVKPSWSFRSLQSPVYSGEGSILVIRTVAGP